MNENVVERFCCNCMSRVGGNFGICPSCGFDMDSWHQPENALPVETILRGRYLIGKTLGIGGFGITYLGLDLETGRRLAIKEHFPSDMAGRENAAAGNYRVKVIKAGQERNFRAGVQDCLEEGKYLAMFQEVPNVVTVREYFTENGTAYLVMDYVSGVTLTAYLRKHEEPMDAEKAVGLIQPVMQSLEQIHTQDVIHRDISPDNILIDAQGSCATLIDFGAAKNYRRKRTESCIKLKRGYAPIEQYEEDGVQGPWTDVYALCATLYRMITGKIPVESKKREDGEKLLFPSEMGISIPSELEEILKKGLAVEPGSRYQSIRSVYEDLQNYASERHKLSLEEEIISRRVRAGEEKRGDDLGKAFWNHADAILVVMIGVVVVLAIAVLYMILGV